MKGGQRETRRGHGFRQTLPDRSVTAGTGEFFVTVWEIDVTDGRVALGCQLDKGQGVAHQV